MAVAEKKTPFGVLHGPHLLVGYLLGLVLVFVGERLIGGQTTTRWVVS